MQISQTNAIAATFCLPTKFMTYQKLKDGGVAISELFYSQAYGPNGLEECIARSQKKLLTPSGVAACFAVIKAGLTCSMSRRVVDLMDSSFDEHLYSIEFGEADQAELARTKLAEAFADINHNFVS